MKELKLAIKNYLEYCQQQKRLDTKTLKAYRIDLMQFSEQHHSIITSRITQEILEEYIIRLHKYYQPKTVKRKIASLKAFFNSVEGNHFISIISLPPGLTTSIHFSGNRVNAGAPACFLLPPPPEFEGVKF